MKVILPGADGQKMKAHCYSGKLSVKMDKQHYSLVLDRYICPTFSKPMCYDF